MRGNREVTAFPYLWGRCGWCPQIVGPNREVVTFYIYVSFFFMGLNAKGWKNKWPKTDKKTRFGVTQGFLLS